MTAARARTARVTDPDKGAHLRVQVEVKLVYPKDQRLDVVYYDFGTTDMTALAA